MKIDLLFAATSDYLPYALVSCLSAIEKSPNNSFEIHFLYADIVNEISFNQRQDTFDLVKNVLESRKVKIHFYDVSKYMNLFKGQNIGMWGEAVSYTHYMYLLASKVLQLDKVIYLDTDIVVNTDLADVWNKKMNKYALALATPSGLEKVADQSNSGFMILNLKKWRELNLFTDLLQFGKTLNRCALCDQNLIYHYFTKKHANLVFYLDKNYNTFAHLVKTPLSKIKILHFAMATFKPWSDHHYSMRGNELWWYYARMTPFYEKFQLQINKRLFINKKNKFKKFKCQLMARFSFGSSKQKYLQKLKNL